MKKAVLALLLAVCCMITGCEKASSPGESAVRTSGDFLYVILPDGTAEIVDYAETTDAPIIPQELDGHTVTSIGDNAFSFCYGLTSVTIPDSVTSIGERAFHYCYSLPKLVIPDGVTSIGDYAFSNCTSLREISIPDSVAFVGANPFTACDNLTDIILSPDHPALEIIDGVLYDKPGKRLVCYPCAFQETSCRVQEGTLAIGERAFYWCSTLTEITLPDSLTSIGDEAFYQCFFTEEMGIPVNVAVIGNDAFYGCRALNLTVELGSCAERYAVENNIPYSLFDTEE